MEKIGCVLAAAMDMLWSSATNLQNRYFINIIKSAGGLKASVLCANIESMPMQTEKKTYSFLLVYLCERKTKGMASSLAG